MQGKEKRQNPRIDFKRPVKFEVCATRQKSDSSQQKARGIDISSGGIGLKAERELRKGEVVKLLIPLGKGGTAVPVFAEVCWMVAADTAFRIGLYFLAQ